MSTSASRRTASGESAEQSYITVRGIGKHFGSGAGTTEALRDISFDVAHGDFVTIVGPSGCGKSTLLRILAGLTPATTGSVKIADKTVTGPTPEAVYLFQQYRQSIFPWLSVADNVMFGLTHGKKVRSRHDRSTCVRYLGMVGLEGFEDHYPWQLSGGMQQRVAIARALAASPDMLLMDEAFSSVDALTRGTLQDLVLSIWTELELTVVFVTHDIDEAIYLSNRVIVLSDRPGRVTFETQVDLERPRDQIETKGDPRYLDLRRSVLEKVLASKGGNDVES